MTNPAIIHAREYAMQYVYDMKHARSTEPIGDSVLARATFWTPTHTAHCSAHTIHMCTSAGVRRSAAKLCIC